MGVEQASHDVLTPLGDIVPVVGGLQVSSAIAYQCMFSSSGRRLKVQQHGSIGSAGLRVVTNIFILV